MKSMLPFQLAFVCLLALAMNLSCKQDKRQELFILTDFVDFEIQPGLNTFDTHFYVIGPKISKLHAQLTATGRTPGDVKTIEPRRAFLASVFEDINLDFIHRVSVYIFDPFNTSDKIEFFYLDPVPFKNKTGIQLFPGIADIHEWMEREYFGIEIRLDFREVTPTLAQMRFEFEVRVLAD
jgi:hypothetical protein